MRSARVVTDPAELRRLKKAPLHYTLTNRWGSKRDMTYCNLGVLTRHPEDLSQALAALAPCD